MEEQKVCEGVYFTDYRQSPGTNSKNPGTEAQAGPGQQQFVTLEQLQQVKDPAEMAYLLASILRRLEWLLESTTFLLDDRDLWADHEVTSAIEENVPLASKYAIMLDWITEKPERCHAVTKEDLEQVAKIKIKADEMRVKYQEFENSKGLLV